MLLVSLGPRTNNCGTSATNASRRQHSTQRHRKERQRERERETETKTELETERERERERETEREREGERERESVRAHLHFLHNLAPLPPFIPDSAPQGNLTELRTIAVCK